MKILWEDTHDLRFGQFPRLQGLDKITVNISGGLRCAD